MRLQSMGQIDPSLSTKTRTLVGLESVASEALTSIFSAQQHHCKLNQSDLELNK